MNYHLQCPGQEVEILTLDDLRRRREAGVLNGTELVWREGMPDWQWLDSVLEADAKNLPRLTPPPLPASSLSNRTVTVLITAAVILFLAEIGWITHRAIKLAKGTTIGKLNSAGSAKQNSITIAKKPVITTNSVTEAEVRKRAKAFRLRQYLEGYEIRGQRNAVCDADSVQLIRQWIAVNYGGPEATNVPTPPELSDRLATNPACTDPIVLLVTALNAGDRNEKINRLERAVKGFESSRHKAYPKFYAAMSLADELQNQADRFSEFNTAAIQHFRECLEDGSWSEQDQPEVAELFINGSAHGFFNRNETALCDLAGAAGKHFQWLALTLSGEHHITEAWRARGGGYVNTVTTEGWRGFAQHLAEARKAYTEAWKLRPDLPLAPSRMIYVSLGDSDLAEMRQWFDRTVAAQIDYPRAWSDMRWGLRPRWYGTLESMREFGITAVNTKRFDTDVPRKFFDSVSDLESERELAPGKHIYGEANIWPHLQRMYEGYIVEPSQRESRDGWRSTYAVVAYLSGKYDIARSQLEALDWKPWPGNLTKWGVDLSLMPLEVAARTSAAGKEFEKAEAARERGDLEAALQIFKKLSEQNNLEERASRFVQCRLASLQMEQRFRAGNWVNLLPTQDDDANWDFVLGRHQRLPDGCLEVTSGSDGHYLFSRARLGTNFEVRGAFELIQPAEAYYNAGLIMGSPDINDSEWMGFRIKHGKEGDSVALSREWNDPGLHRPCPLREGLNHFRFQMCDEKIRIVVNGKRIFNSANVPAKIKVPPGNFLLGIGAPGNSEEVVVRYRTLQIRKISGENANDSNE